MIGYMTVGTNDLEKAVKFFDELFKTMGIPRFMEGENFVAWAPAPNEPSVAVTRPYDEQPATVGNGVMVALFCESPEKVDQYYAKAIELGATCEGKPGPRESDQFYAAYFRDLDGNKFNFFCMTQS